MDGIIRSDLIFTIPGVILIVISGLATAIVGGLPIVRTPWILWSLVLFAVSGIVFVARVAPLQKELRALAQAGVGKDSFDLLPYQAVARRWEMWGALALVTPIAALVLMILKPTF
jgi:uncharacterized membrane protein